MNPRASDRWRYLRQQPSPSRLPLSPVFASMVVSACDPAEGTATIPMWLMSKTMMSPGISRLPGESLSTCNPLVVAQVSHPNAAGDLQRHDSACFGVTPNRASTPGFLSHSATQ